MMNRKNDKKLKIGNYFVEEMVRKLMNFDGYVVSLESNDIKLIKVLQSKKKIKAKV